MASKIARGADGQADITGTGATGASPWGVQQTSGGSFSMIGGTPSDPGGDSWFVGAGGVVSVPTTAPKGSYTGWRDDGGVRTFIAFEVVGFMVRVTVNGEKDATVSSGDALTAELEIIGTPVYPVTFQFLDGGGSVIHSGTITGP